MNKFLFVSFVLAGALFILISLAPAVKTWKSVPREMHGKWRIIVYLMCFFFFGYLLFSLVIFFDNSLSIHETDKLLTVALFFIGALFVFIVINFSQKTIAVLSEGKAALIRASDDWRTTFDSTRDAIFMLDDRFVVIKANAAAAKLLRLSFADVLGKPINDLIFNSDEVTRNLFPEMRTNMLRVEKEFYLPGPELWLRTTADPILDSMGCLSGAVLTLRDTSLEKSLNDSILRAKMEWEDCFNTINEAITIHDGDFNIIRANRAAEELLQLPLHSISQMKCFEIYHGTECPPENCTSCEALTNGNAMAADYFDPHLGKHVELKALPRFDDNGELAGLIHVTRDVTEKKKKEEEHQRLQEQFLQAQKMDSIGRFAAGIAHDLNNILSVVIGYSELSLHNQPEDHQLAEYLGFIKSAGGKAAVLTRHILAFSRQQVLEMHSLNMNLVIEEMEKMISRLIGEDIAVIFHPAPTLPNILADVSQIEQIILNLAVNARDAMPHGGKLTIATDTLTLNEFLERTNHVIPPGHYIRLSVCDNGTGMAPGISEKIFDPFFTTKEMGKGTGLGLSTVYGIVKQHGGYIYVDSKLGSGTTFKVYFPITEKKESTQERQSQQELIPIGSETILIVDDDPSIRKLSRDILHQLGYRLLDAGNAHEAMEISRSLQGPLHLLLIDVVMPETNGREIAELLLRERPETKVLFMSGYTDEIIARHGVLEDGAAFLPKPITRASLAKRVRKAIDSEDSGFVPSITRPAGKRLKILVVAQDRTSFAITKLYANSVSDSILWAENERAAIDLLRSNSFDLMVMDISMPGVDGCDVVRMIRSQEFENENEAAPIIMVTGNITADDRQALMAAGVTNLVSKPLNRAELLRTIDICSKQ